jgi:amino acid adenylation domain-containing protein
MSHAEFLNMHPLTFPQQSIYLDALLHGATTKFNMGGAIVIRGPLDAGRFRQGLECALRVHDAQRMRLHPDGEQAMQEFLPEEECACPFEMLDFASRLEPFPSAIDWVLADLRRPMRVDEFPLHGDVLFRLGDNLHLWYPKFHHASNDAFGHALIAATVAESYNELLRCGSLPGFERHSYADFIRDDRAYAASEQFRKDEAFWHAKFPAMPEPLPFTARKGGLTGDVLRTERCTLGVNRLVYNSVVTRCEEAGVTPFQFLLACLFAYLSRVTGCDDIVAGTPILNRSNHAFRRTAGMFMNMMPLRLRIDRDASVVGLAGRIQAETRSCYRHQRFPLGETLRHCRSLDGFCHAIFDVTVVYRKLDYDIAFGGSPTRVITLDTGAREETLSLEIDEYNQDEDVNLFFNYNPQLISSTEAGQMARAFETLLVDVAVEGDRLVREIRFSPEPATSAAVHRPAASQPTVVDMVERRAAEAPGAVAVVCGEERMTRGDLDRASSRIANFLMGAGAAIPEQPVAVLCGRNTEWIAALVGVLKAGCAYLPLDPEMPRERLGFIVHDSGCRLLLAGAPYQAEVFEGVRSVSVAEASRPSEPTAAPAALSPRSLAYIIYTSGTTEQPKGVLIEHGGFANTVGELMRGWGVTVRDRVLGFAGPMFDASIVDIFLALASGAPLVLASKEAILDPARFLDLLRREGVTVATLPPAYLSALGPVDLTPLRLLVTAGEAANPADVARHVRRLTYVNAYGPTEISVCASYLRMEAGTEFSGARVSIGKAIGRTQISILDEALRPLPVGAAGELCIGGVGLARGYLHRPELTAASFVTNPFREGERLYRTGDLGRLLPDGNIEFLGRRDTQVKIRGYRVEPGEIEAVLKTHPAVETAVVTAFASAGAGELVAYVVPRADFDPRELRRFLASKLPAYMLPSRWIRISTLPLNSSGKVDRDALPDPGAAQDIRPERGSPAPRTPLEKTLAGIWEEVLEVARVGVEDDFFEIGGHSLKAVRVLSRIKHRLGRSLEMADFFAHPTVAGLAASMDRSALAREAPIPAAAPMELYPLSNAQARIWVLAQMEGGSAAYNMPIALELEGTLDEGALERAFRAAIARHESLRTCFVSDNGTPRQKILAAGEVVFELGRWDLAGVAAAEDIARLRIQEEFSRPFDLSRAPLLRASVFRIAERRWLLSVVVHHIVADGWSLDVLLRELSAALGDPAPGLPALPLQYRDYSQWMAGRLERDDLRADRAYWEEKLARPLPVLNLPADYARPAALGFAGAIERFPLPSTGRLNLPRFCAERGVSPFMVLLAAVFGLLHRYSGDEDIVVGTPVSNRERLDLEDQIGLYLNTLALRVGVGRETTLSELLDRVRAVVLEAQQHQSYPFDSLIRDLKVKRSTDRNPLFDVMVVMQDAVRPLFRAPGIRGSEYSVPMGVSVFDLTFHFSPSGAGVRLDLEYNTGMFGRPRTERLSGHLDRVIEAIVSSPDAKLEDVDILPGEERRRILEEFSEGPALPAPTQTVIDLFAGQVLRNPGRTAVVFEQHSLSYADLSAASAQLAGRIGRAGIRPGSVVALVADRSEWMVAGVIGIMASGAACLPIDAAQPRNRIMRILADSGCQAVVSDGGAAAAGTLPVIAIRESGEEGAAPLVGCAQLSDVAYITYTSGSTGTPKGSPIEHRSLANLVGALGRCFYDALPQPSTELLLTSIGFDVAMKQIFGALTRGNTLVVSGDALRHDPAALMALVADGDIHLMDVSPAHFAVLLAQGFARLPKPSLRAIVLGSESLPCGLVEEFARDEANRRIALYNFYGPSECTVETLYCRLDGRTFSGTRIAPIGRPIANARVYVLSPGGQPVPIGIPGEICLGGVPVGRGYLNRPELTASRFVENPFHPGERMYRTGDLGRWTADGIVEFLGREDGQLKIRGYRIEPGEVEYHLLQHPGVSGAVVEGRLSPAGSKELVAWFIASGPGANADSLRTHLSRVLPGYMIPARLVAVPDLPVLVNGKIDRNALPDPWVGPPASPGIDPRNEVESAIRAIWQTVLGIDDAGNDASFFDAGGNSLLLVRLHSMMEERWPGAVKLTELFSAPTVRDQARLIGERTTPPSGEQPVLPAAPQAPAGDGKDRRIAIIGIGLRIGSCQDLDALWEELDRGRDFMRPLPEARRRDAERVATALDLDPANLECAEMAYLDEVDKFDFAHFRMAPQKAAQLDPREKLFLETAWHAIEDAGYSPARLKGTRTGVFLGESMGSADFGRVLEAAGAADVNQLLESLTPSMAASRVSYLLDLKGPAMLVDTACSSALSALSLAMDALRAGQCEMALAGSVKLHLLPLRRHARAEIESPDSRTRSFDDDAAGTGGGEASIAFLLKPLDDALAAGDPIHAVLRGAAMNQDGASTGITAPNADAQADVIDRAWKDAGIHPDELSFIEAHGTGTRLGDPIEVQGLTQAFRRYTGRRQFCALGSIKANLGHTDHAAGLAGLLRAVLCLKHRSVAPAVHYRRPNRNIRFEESPVFVNPEPLALDGKRTPLLGGVSSFGLSGTNVHVVVEEAPRIDRPAAGGERSRLVPLSARTPGLLREHAARMGRYLERHPGIPLEEIVFTLAAGRDHPGARAVFPAGSAVELAAGLAVLSEAFENRPELSLFCGYHKPVPSSKPVLLEHEVTEDTLARLSAAAAALAGTSDASLLAELARLYAAGATVPWEAMFVGVRPARRSLPGYPFERTRSWPEIRQPAFSLLGALKAETPGMFIFESTWRADSHWLLAEHRLAGASVLVGSAYLELAQEAALRIWDTERVEIKRMALLAPLVVEGGETLRVVASVTREKENLRLAVDSHSPSRGWRAHATAELARLSPDHQEAIDIPSLRDQCSEHVALPAAPAGQVEASPRWNCLRSVRRSGNLWFAELGVPIEHAPGLSEFGLYPPLADVALNFATGLGEYLPLWFSGIRIHGRLRREAFACARVLDSSRSVPRFSITVADRDGKVIIAVEEYALKAAGGSGRLEAFLHHTTWTQSAPAPSGAVESGVLLVAAGCDCEPDRRLTQAAAGWSALASSEPQWRAWLDARKPGAEVKIALLLPVCAGGADGRATEVEVEATLHTLFSLSKALAGRRGKSQLLAVGRLAHQVTGEEASLNPMHAAAAGFCRVPEWETAGFRSRFLDLDPTCPGELVLREFRAAFASSDPITAWRQGVRFVPSIEPLDLAASSDRPFSVREGATYLITGGTGGMGLEIARHLAGQARVNLVFVNRSRFPERASWERLETAGTDRRLRARIRTLKEIESLGAAIHLVAADVASLPEMEQVSRDYPDIRAVFHCAGVGNDVFLARHDWDRLCGVLRPKIQGTAVLRDVFGGKGLDAFVLAGSLTAFTGAPGQAGYTAANAFQDVEARRLRAQGLPALSVAWTAWKETGMSAESEKASDDTYRAIATTQALRCLDGALRKNVSHVIVGEPVPVKAVEQPTRAPSAAARVPEPDAGGALLGRPTGAYTATERIVGRLWAEVLGHQELDIYADFDSLGGDSIAAIDILERFQAQTAFRPSLPELLDHPTIEGLGAFLDERQFLTERSAADIHQQLVRLGGSGSRKLFCFAPGSGSCYRYYQLARRLSGWEVFGLNFVETARPAASLAGILAETQPCGGFTLLGYSIGGNLAYEVAHELTALGREVSGLVFIDNWRRLELFRFTGEEYRKNAEEFLAAVDPRYLALTDREPAIRRVECYDRYMDSRLEDRRVDCPIHLIQAESSDLRSPFRITQEGWGELTSDFHLWRGSGRHLEMLDEPHVGKNAALVQQTLESIAPSEAAEPQRVLA